MLLAHLVEVSAAVRATRSRTEKIALLADGLRAAEPEEVGLVATYLAGALRQRRTGLGWRTVGEVTAPPAAEPSLGVVEVDAAFEAMGGLSGPSSATRRREAWATLLSRATPPEQEWLRAIATGEVRQGALDSLLLDAVASATGVPLTAVRRAAMLAGSSAHVAEVAAAGGQEALAAIGLEAGRAIRPMLAGSEPDVPAALARLQEQADGPHAVEVKLDGLRIQAHRVADDVRVYSRSLDDLTERVPAVVEAVRALPVETVVLDGEALALDETGRARPFQESTTKGAALVPRFFDLLHHDGRDLLDEPARARWEALDALVPADLRVERLLTDSPADAEAFAARALDAGHEGVVLKGAHTTYAAGRRGAGWIKVKPRRTADLVVLAVEWGSGRRQGTLSNIHLGARDGETGELVMIGKTFKGMTDAILAWQTERFLGLQTHTDGHVVHVRPEQVVEIAYDGVQRSTRYPGGIALRFARVLGYREDKGPEEVDTLDSLRAGL